jgi:hypothetical protein
MTCGAATQRVIVIALRNIVGMLVGMLVGMVVDEVFR